MDFYYQLFNSVIDDVSEKEQDILNIQGKDLIIFLGPTGSGKSSLINSILGIRFILGDDNTLIPTQNNLIAPIGELSEGGISCTDSPAQYYHASSNTTLLDNQGIFDNRGNFAMNLTSSILMKMAINQAKSIRVVFLTKYDDFKFGMSTFDRIGKELSKLFNTDQVPIYFLFNRFQPSVKLGRDGFYSWNKQKQYSIIYKEIYNSYEIIMKGGKSVIIGIWDRFANRAKKLGATIKKQYDNFNKKLIKSKNCRTYGCIKYDNTNNNNNNNYSNNDYNNKDNNNNDNNDNDNNNNNDYNNNNNNDDDNEDNYIDHTTKNCNYFQNRSKSNLFNQSFTVNVSDFELIDQNEEIKRKLERDEEYHELNEKARYLALLENNFSNKNYGYVDPTDPLSVKKILDEILHMPIVDKSNFIFNEYNKDRIHFNQIFSNRIADENKFLTHVLYSMQYPEETIDYLIGKIKQNLESYKDTLNKINDKGINDDIIIEINKYEHLHLKRLTNALIVLQNEYISKQREKEEFQNRRPIPFWEDKWDKIAAVLWWRNHLCKYDLNIPYVKVKEELDEYTFRYKIIAENSPQYEVKYSSGGKVRRGLGIAAGILISPVGIASLSIFSHRCKGKVTFYAYPKDIHPNYIKQLDKKMQDISYDINCINNSISLIKQENEIQITQKMNNMINALEKQLSHLQLIKSQVHSVTKIWNEKKDKIKKKKTKKEQIKSYYNIIKKLYNDISNENILNQFVKLYDDISSVKPKNINLIEVESIIIEARSLFDLENEN